MDRQTQTPKFAKRRKRIRVSLAFRRILLQKRSEGNFILISNINNSDSVTFSEFF